jgi:hypothetical protein
MSETLQLLLRAFNQVAPNSMVQAALLKQVHTAQRASLPEKDTLLIITGAIFDGLAYGNWPGVTNV